MNEQYMLNFDTKQKKYELLLYLGKHPIYNKYMFQPINMNGNFSLNDKYFYTLKFFNYSEIKFLSNSQLLNIVLDDKDIYTKKIKIIENKINEFKNRKNLDFEDNKKNILFNIKCCTNIIEKLKAETESFPILSIENSLLIDNYLFQIRCQNKGLRRLDGRMKKFNYENRSVVNNIEILNMKDILDKLSLIEKYLIKKLKGKQL